ncbi:MAG: hypothetical protein U0470_03465 [Anaerolineae bacterium]
MRRGLDGAITLVDAADPAHRIALAVLDGNARQLTDGADGALPARRGGRWRREPDGAGLAAAIPSVVLDVLVAEGDVVADGQKLVLLDDEDGGGDPGAVRGHGDGRAARRAMRSGRAAAGARAGRGGAVTSTPTSSIDPVAPTSAAGGSGAGGADRAGGVARGGRDLRSRAGGTGCRASRTRRRRSRSTS